MAPPQIKTPEIHYPESDGKPMAETDVHRNLMVDLIAAVNWRFRDDPNLYVSGNLFVYYEEGDPHRNVAPDFFVVRGVPKQIRRTFKVWQERKAPELVIELTSRSTDLEDRGTKRAIYEELGVKEYFLFDPEAARIRITGLVLERGYFAPMRPARVAGELVVFRSEVLGLELHGRPGDLRWVDPATGDPLPIPLEAYEQAQAAVALAEQERARAEQERARAEQERARAEQERERADREKARADRLEAELKQLRGGGS